VKKFSVSLCAALALVPSLLPGQARKGLSPTEVAREFFAAESDGRWIDAAQLLDLAAFERTRQFAIQTASKSTSFGARTPEQIMAEQPDMPRAVAEYFAKQIAHMTDRDALP
jgi:hypothetical protein